MIINGCTVDKNLPAFRKAFFLPDLLHELDYQFAIWKWIGDMCELPHLSQNTKERFAEIKNAMRDFFENAKGNDWTIDATSYSETRGGFMNHLRKWNQRIKPEMNVQFQSLCYIILELMAVAGYSATTQDESTFLAYLDKHDYFLTQCLEIKLRGGKYPQLYYGDQMVTELPNTNRYPSRGLATMTEHPNVGFLGITEDGYLVNCSAFMIPALKKRPVKVLMNQMNYVILLEDGSLVHNLRFCEVPSVPVRDISLDRDHMYWTPM